MIHDFAMTSISLYTQRGSSTSQLEHNKILKFSF